MRILMAEFETNIRIGYYKMVDFKKPTGGFYWFKQPEKEGNEVLTAFGLNCFYEIIMSFDYVDL
jgi:hypothetical protein